jgi:alpha-amylase
LSTARNSHFHSPFTRTHVSSTRQEPPVYQEVIEDPCVDISSSEYFKNGLVLEFDYGAKIAEFFKRSDRRLGDLRTFGERWRELMPSNRAVVFIDNHDTQRGHAGGGVLNYKDGALYDLANVFMLTWPYGYPALMSSYEFTDTEAGPPSVDGKTKRVHDGERLDCFGSDWVCEHRRPQIANMVAFRNHTLSDWHVDNWWDNGNNQIAFGRGDKGFVVINKEDSALDRTLETGMPPGRVLQCLGRRHHRRDCSGSTITVDRERTARFRVPAMAAIHVGQKVDGEHP